ncbi:hypothetical protein IW262DRAFT_1300382 [Armillaria fumosa]|nr:hypothetical protein IW262DRAFT_1300382 [Armillaria fumosa]
MSSQPNFATFEHDLRFELEKIPLELFEEIVSHLDIPTIKRLSRVSSVFHEACIPLFFRNLVLYGGSSGRSTEILANFKERTLVPSLRKVELRDLECLVGNTSLLPSLIFLYDLKLSNLTFESAEGYFRLLACLPPTLKKLAVLGNTFLESQLISYAAGPGIEVDHLQTESAEDLSLLLRDDCPISLKSLRVANVSRACKHDLERLIQRTPRLLDLKIEIKKREDRPEVVNFSMIIFGWVDGLGRLVAAFSLPRFCKLKQVNITILQSSHSNTRYDISRAILNDYARLAERGLEAAGRSPGTQVTLNMERRLAKSDGPVTHSLQ